MNHTRKNVWVILLMLLVWAMPESAMAYMRIQDCGTHQWSREYPGANNRQGEYRVTFSADFSKATIVFLSQSGRVALVEDAAAAYDSRDNHCEVYYQEDLHGNKGYFILYVMDNTAFGKAGTGDLIIESYIMERNPRSNWSFGRNREVLYPKE